MNLELENRVALVCGASKGIGKAAALALSQEGAKVVILSRSSGNLEAAAAEIEEKSGSRPDLIPLDVGVAGAAQEAVGRTVEAHGRLDILVNNAGGPPMGTFLEHSSSTWDAAFRTNLLSVIEFTSEAARVMKEHGYGRIINVTSTLAKEPTPAMVLSATLRAGVSAFSKAISGELAPHGITVNTVCPSAVQTERAEELTRQVALKEGITVEEAFARAAKTLPMGRLAMPRELGEVVAFLASARASYLTGVSLMVDGGFTRSVF